MLIPGLVSVTFRKLSPQKIVSLTLKAGLSGIEWGGDIHVPHGNINTAQKVLALTQDAGLKVAAYGSYYRAGESDSPAFEAVLDSAVALHAPTIRVWAGRTGSREATPERRVGVADDLRQICGLAQNADVRVSLEFHGGTLTDTNESAADLLRAVSHDNLDIYWQPGEGRSPAECLAGIDSLFPRIRTIHVFQWTRPGGERVMHPLAEGVAVWRTYLRRFAKPNDLREHWALLEFVRNDDEEQFLADAATLHALLREVDAPGA